MAKRLSSSAVHTRTKKQSESEREGGESEREQKIRNESKSKAAITSSSAHPGLEQGHVKLFLPARSARLVYRFLIVFLFFFFHSIPSIFTTPPHA